MQRNFAQGWSGDFFSVCLLAPLDDAHMLLFQFLTYQLPATRMCSKYAKHSCLPSEFKETQVSLSILLLN